MDTLICTILCVYPDSLQTHLKKQNSKPRSLQSFHSDIMLSCQQNMLDEFLSLSKVYKSICSLFSYQQQVLSIFIHFIEEDIYCCLKLQFFDYLWAFAFFLHIFALYYSIIMFTFLLICRSSLHIRDVIPFVICCISLFHVCLYLYLDRACVVLWFCF